MFGNGWKPEQGDQQISASGKQSLPVLMPCSPWLLTEAKQLKWCGAFATGSHNSQNRECNWLIWQPFLVFNPNFLLISKLLYFLFVENMSVYLESFIGFVNHQHRYQLHRFSFSVQLKLYFSSRRVHFPPSPCGVRVILCNVTSIFFPIML
jgi:hypothetical protein